MTGVLNSDGGSRADGQTSFGLLCFEHQGLVASRIFAGVFFEFAEEAFCCHINQDRGPVESAEFKVTVRCDDLHLIIGVAHDRQVKRSAAEIKDQQSLVDGQFCEC